MMIAIMFILLVFHVLRGGGRADEVLGAVRGVEMDIGEDEGLVEEMVQCLESQSPLPLSITKLHQSQMSRDPFKDVLIYLFSACEVEDCYQVLENLPSVEDVVWFFLFKMCWNLFDLTSSPSTMRETPLAMLVEECGGISHFDPSYSRPHISSLLLFSSYLPSAPLTVVNRLIHWEERIHAAHLSALFLFYSPLLHISEEGEEKLGEVVGEILFPLLSTDHLMAYLSLLRDQTQLGFTFYSFLQQLIN